MYGSDAMALSMVVGIPDLAQIYMEPMETASSNLHASGHTYCPQGRHTFQNTTLSLLETHALYGSDAMALSIVVGIPDPDLVYT